MFLILLPFLSACAVIDSFAQSPNPTAVVVSKPAPTIQSPMAEHPELPRLLPDRLQVPAIDLDTLPSMQACVLCQTPKSQLRRYGLVGLCSGEELLVLGQGEAAIPMPCLICDRCNQGLEKKLSKATREEWDRFVEEHFPGPPGVELDPVHDRPIMV